jgi:capsule polysaccharide export protein KpsC/LpsZ
MVLLRKKIKDLFYVNYNNSAKLCNPYMDACKKVNNKINGKELSTVSNIEMKKHTKVFSSQLIV